MMEVAHDFDLSEQLATPDSSGTIYIQVVDSVLSIGKQGKLGASKRLQTKAKDNATVSN